MASRSFSFVQVGRPAHPLTNFGLRIGAIILIPVLRLCIGRRIDVERGDERYASSGYRAPFLRMLTSLDFGRRGTEPCRLTTRKGASHPSRLPISRPQDPWDVQKPFCERNARSFTHWFGDVAPKGAGDEDYVGAAAGGAHGSHCTHSAARCTHSASRCRARREP